MKGIQPCSLERVHLFKQTVCTKSEGIVQPLPWGILKECCVQAEQEADRFCQMDFVANGKHSHSSTPTKLLTSTSSIDYRLPKLHFRFCSRSPCGSQTCCHHFCWHDGLRWSSNFLMKKPLRATRPRSALALQPWPKPHRGAATVKLVAIAVPQWRDLHPRLHWTHWSLLQQYAFPSFWKIGWNSNGLCLFQQKVVWTQSYSCDSRTLIEIQMMNDLLYTFIIQAMFT